jgi:hypothetical protein
MASPMAVKARCVVDILRPAASVDGFGQNAQAQPESLYKQVPCLIQTLTGRELVQARTVFANVTHQVTKLYLDPKKRIKAKDYLLLNGRRLSIGFPNDVWQNGIEWECLCNEEV